MNAFRIGLVVVAVVLSSCVTTPEPAPPPPPPPELNGAWQTACFAVHNADDTDGSARVVYSFTDTLWSTDTMLFADAACGADAATATVHVDGGYVLEGPSTSTNGAYDLRLDVRTRSVTPHVEGFVAFLQAMSCGGDDVEWGVDRANDAFDLSCPALGLVPVPTCATLFDVVRVEDASLWRGRDGDKACAAAARPSTLGTTATHM